MDHLVIAGYSSTCMGLPRLLRSFMTTQGVKFSFELFATGSSNAMIEMLKRQPKEHDHADVALFTLSEARRDMLDGRAMYAEKTADFSFVVIAPGDQIGDVEAVSADWLDGRDIVTYGGGSVGAEMLDELLGGFKIRARQAIHGVPDTLTINEVVKAGLATGVAVGLNQRYEVAPGVIAVPIRPSTPLTEWHSYVAIRSDLHSKGGLARKFFETLVEMDRTEEPGWIIANPALGLHPYHQEMLRRLSQDLHVSEVAVVRQALDLFNLAVDESHNQRHLAVTDQETSRVYALDMDLIGANT